MDLGNRSGTTSPHKNGSFAGRAVKTLIWVVNDADLPQPRATMNEVGDNLPRKPPAFAIEELWLRYFKPRILHMMSRKDAGDAVLSNADQVIQRNLATLDKETHLPRLAELGS